MRCEVLMGAGVSGGGRVSENGMLRERIAELEQELAAQEQKLKELAEGSSAQGLPRRRRRRRLARRRPDDYDDYDEYDDDYPDYDDYDDRRSGGGGRRRYADEEWEEWEEWEEVYDEREVPQPSRGLNPNGGGVGSVGNGLRRPPQPVKRRAAIRQVKGEDPEQGGQMSRGGATDRRSDVRHIFERGYDEL
jgi:hypothetical protein